MGFGLIEIVIVTALVTGALAAFSQASIAAVHALRAEKERLEATLLAQEGLEASRAVRDESWGTFSSLANNVRYYPVIENNKWKLSPNSPGLINGTYDRYVILEPVLRDAQDRIAGSGTVDSGTRKATARATSTTVAVTLATYFTNFQGSLVRLTEAPVIVFDGPDTDADLANFPSANTGNGDPAQSFTTGISALSVSKVELLLRRMTSTPSMVYAELRAGPTGNVLATSNIINSATITMTSPSWIEFRFLPAVQLAALTNYTIRMRSNPDSTIAGSGSLELLHWQYKQTSQSPYDGGVARRYVGRLGNPADAGQLLDQYDFGFKVYGIQ